MKKAYKPPTEMTAGPGPKARNYSRDPGIPICGDGRPALQPESPPSKAKVRASVLPKGKKT